jgi:Fic family protein
MTTDGAAGSWPAVGFETVPWESRADEQGQSRRAALRARGPYQAAVPPRIARQTLPTLSDGLVVHAEDALLELSRFDTEVGAIAAPFSAILLRSESAASSEIEQLTASAKNIALAELGRKSGANSTSIVGNVRAMEAAIDLADDLDAAAIVRMQAEILRDDQPEHTGGWRDQPVWIGGGYSNSPHTAAFVPPHHGRVAALMDDLVVFATRTDLPAIAQIAVAHAQFETIHPFPDGNGRTGRALIQAMLRRLGVTRHVTVPVSAGLLRDTGGYFDALSAYRDGDVEPMVRALAVAASDAIVNGRRLVTDLSDIRSSWDDRTTARSGSSARRLLDLLQRLPVIDVRAASEQLRVSTRNVQDGLERLISDGILRQIGSAARSRVYEAPEVLAALDGFAARAKRRR